LQNLSKSTQLKAIMRWLSKDTLPAYVASFHRMNLWVRQPSAGTTAIALLNSYLDPAQGVELLVRTGNDLMRVTDMRGLETLVKADRSDDLYRRFALPTILPWEMALALV
jgi:hypothetical protein